MRTAKTMLLAMTLLLLVGCQAARESTPKVLPEPHVAPLASAPIQELVATQNAFTFDFYRTVDDASGNIFVSPVSVATALTMVERGAMGNTRTEMQHTLRTTTLSDVDNSYYSLLTSLNRTGNYTLTMSNALWLSETFTPKQSYVELLATRYFATVQAVNFQTVGPSVINAWANTQTHGLIPSIVNQIDPSTVAILTNAVYFKGDWSMPFTKADSYEGKFYLKPGMQNNTHFMMQTEHFAYGETTDAQLLELPYADGSVSMLVVLPKESQGLVAVESTLSSEQFAFWRASLIPQDVVVRMPSFKLHWKDSIVQNLQSLGMRDMFTGNADLSGISDGVQVSDVLHEAVVIVDEEGTEAAAITTVYAVAGSAVPMHAPPEFTADHPFLFFIVDNKTGAILFMGRVADPTS